MVQAVILVAIMATQSLAVTYGFSPLANDFSQAEFLSLDVADAGNGKASFMFTNAEAAVSNITSILWDFSELDGNLKYPSWTSHPYASFEEMKKVNAHPWGLNNVSGFGADYGLNREKKGGVNNGLNGGEWLNVVWALSGITFDQLITALNSNDLMIGIHVQSVGPGGEESFGAVSAPTPIPGAVWLLGSGIIGLVGFRRKMSV